MPPFKFVTPGRGLVCPALEPPLKQGAWDRGGKRNGAQGEEFFRGMAPVDHLRPAGRRLSIAALDVWHEKKSQFGLVVRIFYSCPFCLPLAKIGIAAHL
ncbi:hypothetical protein TNCV_2446511 [Trichonephila clavipes]|nr:hypothetical protein TNCV_2446511 [Trichonephila clavipes]